MGETAIKAVASFLLARSLCCLVCFEIFLKGIFFRPKNCKDRPCPHGRGRPKDGLPKKEDTMQDIHSILQLIGTMAKTIVLIGTLVEKLSRICKLLKRRALSKKQS